MSRRFVIIGAVIVLLLGGLGYFQFVFKPQMIRTFLSKMTPPAATVTAEPAHTEKWVERLTSIGTLIASQGVDVTSQVAGIVTEVLIDSGAEVEQGTRLVQLDTSVELADLASAIATHREAEVAYERQVDLMQKRVTSEANLDTARAKRETAGAGQPHTGGNCPEGHREPSAAGSASARWRRANTSRPAWRWCRWQALNPIRVDFPMPEQYVGKLRVGQPIELTVDAFPNQVFGGEIQSLDARVAQDTRTLLVRGLLPNQERKLLPGMFANVTVLVGDATDVVTVPRTAIAYSLYGDSVYVVTVARKTKDAAAKLPKLIAERRSSPGQGARTASPSPTASPASRS
jgi:membrane fusion protein (multidrug efflux system)